MDSLKCKHKLIFKTLSLNSFNQLSKSKIVRYVLTIGAVGLLVASFAFSMISNYASFYNYPGGDAIKFFNRDYRKLFKHLMNYH